MFTAAALCSIVSPRDMALTKGERMKRLLALLLVAGIAAAASNAAADEYGDMLKKADLLYKEGGYREAAELYEKAFEIKSPDGKALYNVACYWNLAGDREKALEYLERSRKLQGLNLNHISRDPDLESLRDDPRFRKLMLRQCDDEFDIDDPDQYDHFNAADCYAMAGDDDRAFQCLGKALEGGFVNRSLMLEYSRGIAGLKEDPRWPEMEKKLEDNIRSVEESMPDMHEVLETIDLPEPRYDGVVSVERALMERRSVRRYSGEALTLADCSQVLWAAYGITYTSPDMPAFLRGGLKTAPSAGARYPLELYLVAYGVSDLPSGTYWYQPDGHKLFKIAEGDIRRELSRACLGQEWLEGAAFSVVYSAVFSRTTGRYGERGRERYVCMDLGHSGENVYLQCGSLGLGTCAIGAFVDIELKRLIRMTREEEPLYVMPVGRLVKE